MGSPDESLPHVDRSAHATAAIAHSRRGRVGRVLLRVLVGLGLLAILLWIAHVSSPRPGVALIRFVFDRGARAASEGLAPHVPPGIASVTGERYDADDRDALLDLYRPAEPARALPTIVWIHGGAWVSGSRADIANYAQILAARGFAVASIDYTLAPDATHPRPVRQANAALGHLVRHAERLRVDPRALFLAGDSAGAQIAAQLALGIADPDYARRLAIEPAIARTSLLGTLLFCGAYDLDAIDLEGSFGSFLRTVLWAYSGARDHRSVPGFDLMSVGRHVTAHFPPAFISAGNADPLEPQSRAFAARLAELGVPVDALFFPADHAPPLPHEFQFDLEGEAGRLALERAVAFGHARFAAARAEAR